MNFDYKGRTYRPLFSTNCQNGTVLVLTFAEDNAWLILRDGKPIDAGTLADVGAAALKYLKLVDEHCTATAL